MKQETRGQEAKRPSRLPAASGKLTGRLWLAFTNLASWPLGLWSLVLLPASLASQTPDTSQRVDSVGRLYAPAFVQERAPTTPRDDDALIRELEHKLRCTCGCNLDVYTCRTTDFTCGTSPAMHQVVLARIDSGMTAEQVIAAFEAQYGQSVLMAPPKRGFNWAAYIMPFVGLGIGIGLLGMAMRRLVRAHAAEKVLAADDGAPAAPPSVSAEEMERLKKELQEFEA
jgi:cytochrome c-type biogenesis protein CcmH